MLRGLDLRIPAGIAGLVLWMVSPGLFSQPLNDVCIEAELVQFGDGLVATVAGSTAEGATQDPETTQQMLSLAVVSRQLDDVVSALVDVGLTDPTVPPTL